MKNQYPERFYILDVFRGFAALAVVLFHYRLFYAFDVSLNPIVDDQLPLYSIFSLAYDHGWIAVNFFLLCQDSFCNSGLCKFYIVIFKYSC